MIDRRCRLSYWRATSFILACIDEGIYLVAARGAESAKAHQNGFLLMRSSRLYSTMSKLQYLLTRRIALQMVEATIISCLQVGKQSDHTCIHTVLYIQC